jgi:hypothetical protein
MKSTKDYQIVKVECLQNIRAWKRFQIFKTTNRHTKENAMLLFHGTKKETVDKITTRGFDRNFVGENGNVYGNGTYFAIMVMGPTLRHSPTRMTISQNGNGWNGNDIMGMVHSENGQNGNVTECECYRMGMIIYRTGMLQNGNVWNGNDMMGMIQNGNDTEWE